MGTQKFEYFNIRRKKLLSFEQILRFGLVISLINFELDFYLVLCIGEQENL